MNNRPLLLFPQPQLVGRSKPGGKPRNPHVPSHQRQVQRLAPQFRELQLAVASISGSASGLPSEQVIVLETVGGIEEFVGAVQRLGLEWLGEVDQSDIPPDDDFFQDEAHREKSLGGRLYLTMASQAAINQLLSLWANYSQNEQYEFDYGLSKWRDVFKQLRTIRRWGVQDRLLETGILADWQERIRENQERVRCEVELWYHDTETGARASQREIAQLVAEEGGEVIDVCRLPSIAYHALLVELPLSAVSKVMANTSTSLVSCNQVMFFKPVGQLAIPLPDDEPFTETDALGVFTEAVTQEPVVALLDGLPLANHQYLANRIVIDDPDEWGNEYPFEYRNHGTAMASLIIHGELDANEQPLARPLYVRPILKPDLSDWRAEKREVMPDDLLPVNLVYRAVRRMFEGENGHPPSAPYVRIINFSVGDPNRLFYQLMTPLARLLDWLSFQYNVLFVVSAGNHSSEIVLDVERSLFSSLSPEACQAAVIKAIVADLRNRRLLAPGEALNVLTIGATHHDQAPSIPIGHLIDPFISNNLPSPFSAFGFGYRRAVKPDVLLPGGRQLYSEKLGNAHPQATLKINTSTTRPPGQRVAATSPTPGTVNAFRYIRGTSNAAALATRTLAQLYETVSLLQSDDYEGKGLSEHYYSVLLKTLIVHGARWGETYNLLESVLKKQTKRARFKEYWPP